MLQIDEDIFDTIYPICRYVEKSIVQQESDRVCDWWGAKNALRHMVTINFLRRQSQEIKNSIKILNLSGLSCGHQDFAICHYFIENNIPFEYCAIEHPATPYREDAEFQRMVNDHKINVIYADLAEIDHKKIEESFGQPNIVLFTEIAEHLPHDLFLRSLSLVRQILSAQGKFFLTTPNSDRLHFRINTLLGRETEYWGDGQANFRRGLFGHIVYYNIARLRRLLADVGLTMCEAKTFDFPIPAQVVFDVSKWRSRSPTSLQNSLIKTGEKLWRMPTLSHMVKTIGEQIVLVAEPGDIREVPFAL